METEQHSQRPSHSSIGGIQEPVSPIIARNIWTSKEKLVAMKLVGRRVANLESKHSE
jgi:hypothetical protein